MYPILCDPMDGSPLGSTVHGIFQARILKWVAISSSRESSSPRELNPSLLHLLLWQVHSLPLSHLGSPKEQCSVQFSCSVVSDSLWPHELQHARPPYPSPTPRVLSNSHPSSQWCHPAISSSVIPFSSCSQSLPVSESFLMSQLFAWGGQCTGVSALVSFLPKNTQDWSPLEWTGWISLQSMVLF